MRVPEHVSPRPEDAGVVRAALSGPEPLAGRTRALLAGLLDAPDLEIPMAAKGVVPLRLDAATVERADALAGRLTASTGVGVTRSAVLRAALERGLDAMEAEQGKARRKRHRKG